MKSKYKPSILLYYTYYDYYFKEQVNMLVMVNIILTIIIIMNNVVITMIKVLFIQKIYERFSNKSMRIFYIMSLHKCNETSFYCRSNLLLKTVNCNLSIDYFIG